MATKKKNDGLGLGLVSKSDIKNVNTMESSINNLAGSFDKLVNKMGDVVSRLTEITKGFTGMANSANKANIPDISKFVKFDTKKEVRKLQSGKSSGIQGTMFGLDYEEAKNINNAYKEINSTIQKIAKTTVNQMLQQEGVNKSLLSQKDALNAYIGLQTSSNALSAIQSLELSKSKQYLDSFVQSQIASTHLSTQQTNALRQSAEYLDEMVKNQTENNLSQVAQTNALAQSESYISSILQKEQANANLQKQIEKVRYAQLTPLEKVSSKLAEIGNKLQKNSVSTSMVTRAASSLAAQVMSYVNIGRLTAEIKQSIGDWVENMNLFSVAFDKAAEPTYDWAMKFAENLGIAKYELTEMLGLFREMTGAIGLEKLATESGNLADEISKQFTSLSYDISSFFNVDVSSVADSLQSGIISGQIRTLRKFGVDISQEAVQTLLSTNEALKQFDASAENMSQSQKVLARTILTLQAIGSDVSGDMAKTITSLANRQRVFQAQLTNLKTNLGAISEKYFSRFYAYMIAVVKVINDTLEEIFGVSKLLKDMGLKDTGADAESVAKGMSDAEKSVEGLDEATKNYQETLGNFSFDKFETLTSSSSLDSENDALTQALIKQYEEVQNAYQKQLDEQGKATDTLVESIYQKLSSNGGIKGAIQSIIRLVESIKPILSEIVSSVAKIAPEVIMVYAELVRLVVRLLVIIEKLGLIKPLVYAIFAASVYKSVISPIGSMLKGFGTMFDWLKKILGLKAATAATEGVSKFSKIASAKGAQLQRQYTALNATVAALGFSFLAITTVSFFSDKTISFTWKLVTAFIALAAAITATAIAINFTTLNWAGALGIGAAVAGGVLTVSSALNGFVNGYENGGIPEKSELFYMNEYGKPEALVNTGGSNTNVINIDQLSEGMRRGFVAAIKETGLADGEKLIVEGRNIDNNVVARGLFNALKVESKRRGGDQL